MWKYSKKTGRYHHNIYAGWSYDQDTGTLYYGHLEYSKVDMLRKASRIVDIVEEYTQ